MPADLNDEVTEVFPVKVKRTVASESHRLNWRVDVAFRLSGEPPDAPLCVFEGLTPIQVRLVVNRPSEANVATVTLSGDALPFDLELVQPKSMTISLWPYTHQQPRLCDHGDKEQFRGVVDEIERDRYTLKTRLECRDLTAIPLGAKLTEEQVKSFPVSTAATVEQLVASILYAIPGTKDWKVVSLSAGGSRLAIETPLIEPKARSKSSSAPPPASVSSPATAHLAAITGPGELTAWGAIAAVCARAGCVPEIRLSPTGDPVVVLVDSADLQTSTVLRPFFRDGRQWRVVTDGRDIHTFREQLTLNTSAGRPDFVQVASINPATGVGLSARYPPAPVVKGGSDEGTFHFVSGVTSQESLLRMARGSFLALAHNMHRVTIALKVPWTTGGDNGMPDALTLGYGAAIEIAMPRFEEVAKKTGLDTPGKILEARSVPAPVRARILRAQEQLGALSLLFQVEQVSHDWTGGTGASYICEIKLRRFMGTAEMPIIDSRAALPREVV